MTDPKKIGVVALVVAAVVFVAYRLGYLLPTPSPPADLGNARIAFRAGSSPLLSGLFLNYDIYVMDFGTSGLTRITREAGIDAMPAWSPQGDKIVYYSAEGLYVVNADGSGQPELLRRGSTLDSAWSPDGSKIAFSEGVIYLLDLETKQTVQLTDGLISSIEPTWSPDSSKIAFTILPFMRTPGGGPESAIAVINADGSDFVQLTNVEEGSSGAPVWSPDGRQIAFEREGDIYMMNADGTNVRTLTHDRSNLSPTWSPDGTRIAFVSVKNSRCGPVFHAGYSFCTSELYVMNADGSNVIKIREERNERIVDPAWSP